MNGPVRQPVTRLKLGGTEGPPSILANTYTQQPRQSQPSSVPSSVGPEESKASFFVRLRSLISNRTKPSPSDPTQDETYKNLALSFGHEAIQPPNLDEEEHASHEKASSNTPRS